MAAKTFENPLIPNQRLKQIYADMRGLRKSHRRARGLEACLAATAAHLRPQDTISAASFGEEAALIQQSSGNILPATLDVVTRFSAGHGAAFANKHFTPGSVALIYIEEELPAEAAKLLQFTAERELPVVYVQLPSGKPHPAALKFKIPVIPVDACDAVAIFRVAQEALTRARTLSLPTWIACTKLSEEDPIQVMETYLKNKGLLARS